jgi:hypothetical protein
VIDDLGHTDDGITHATARFGYMDQPNVPAIVRQIEGAPNESPIDINEVSYFLSKIDLCRGNEGVDGDERPYNEARYPSSRRSADPEGRREDRVKTRRPGTCRPLHVASFGLERPRSLTPIVRLARRLDTLLPRHRRRCWSRKRDAGWRAPACVSPGCSRRGR